MNGDLTSHDRQAAGVPTEPRSVLAAHLAVLFTEAGPTNGEARRISFLALVETMDAELVRRLGRPGGTSDGAAALSLAMDRVHECLLNWYQNPPKAPNLPTADPAVVGYILKSAMNLERGDHRGRGAPEDLEHLDRARRDGRPGGGSTVGPGDPTTNLGIVLERYRAQGLAIAEIAALAESVPGLVAAVVDAITAPGGSACTLAGEDRRRLTECLSGFFRQGIVFIAEIYQDREELEPSEVREKLVSGIRGFSVVVASKAVGFARATYAHEFVDTLVLLVRIWKGETSTTDVAREATLDVGGGEAEFKALRYRLDQNNHRALERLDLELTDLLCAQEHVDQPEPLDADAIRPWIRVLRRRPRRAVSDAGAETVPMMNQTAERD